MLVAQAEMLEGKLISLSSHHAVALKIPVLQMKVKIYAEIFLWLE